MVGVVMKAVYGSIGLAIVLCSTGLGYYWGSSTHPSTSAANTSSQGKILYYRNPMGLADTSPTPKQDSMGMDYIPVYENELDSSNLVHIDNRKVQLLGVQTHKVQEQSISRDIRALGNLEIDETRISNISPMFDGSIVRLFANSTGKVVERGEILFEVMVPDMFLAELRYRKAVAQVIKTATASKQVQLGANTEMSYALEALEELGIPHDEIERLKRGGEPFQQFNYRSPAGGTIIQKNVVEGSRFLAGKLLYQVVDLTNLWLTFEVPEHELPHIKVGDELEARFIANGDKAYTAKVDFIYPVINKDNRSVKLRALIDNTNGNLKPGQTAEVWLHSNKRKALVIPTNALLDSGNEQWVLLAKSEGIYQPHPVTVGERQLDWVEVTGLCEDDQVVTNANFLIDSESRLQAALANFKGDSKDDSSTMHHHSDTEHKASSSETSSTMDDHSHHGMEH